MLSLYKLKLFKELMYYWTSAAFFGSNEEENGKISTAWCSTNTTSSSIPRKITYQDSAEIPRCIAFERMTGVLRPVSCSKKLSFVCEVELIVFLFAQAFQITRVLRFSWNLAWWLPLIRNVHPEIFSPKFSKVPILWGVKVCPFLKNWLHESASCFYSYDDIL
jgi:hypothetical protein